MYISQNNHRKQLMIPQDEKTTSHKNSIQSFLFVRKITHVNTYAYSGVFVHV